jgi:phospholipid transport system substrate-binding protein
LLLDSVDVERIGRCVLGRYARKASAEQQAEYRRLFQAYLLTTYTARLDQYAGDRLEVAEARLLDGRRAVVTSAMIRRQDPPVELDWQLLWEEGRWKVVDVVVEGVSLAVSQRSEFRAVIKAGGGQVEALLVRLREAAATTRRPLTASN